MELWINETLDTLAFTSCDSFHAAKLQKTNGIYKDFGNKMYIYLYFRGKMLDIFGQNA